MTPFHPGSGLSVGLGDRIFGFVFAKRLSSPSPWNVQKTNGAGIWVSPRMGPSWELGGVPRSRVRVVMDASLTLVITIEKAKE
ncbi:MAG: hypothetical protein Rhob2KO_29850 [Rhodopirellula baltica]